MNNILKGFYWILIVLVFASCNNDKRAAKIPYEAFFKNPEKTSFLVSPNGKYISYLQPFEKRFNIFVQTTDGTSSKRITSETDRDILTYFWANNETLFYMRDRKGDDGFQLIAINANGSNSQNLLPASKFRIKLINPNSVRNNEILIALNNRDSSVFDAYRLNLVNHKLTLAAQNPGNITEWHADEDGELRLAMSSDGVNETLLFRDSEKAGFKPVITTNFKTNIKPLGFCNTEKTRIFALSNLNRDKAALVEFNCLTGKEEKEIFSHPEGDVIEIGYARGNRRISHVTFETWKKQRSYLNDSVKAVYEGLEKRLPNSEIRIVSRDYAEKTFIIKTSTDKTPGAFYLYTLNNNKLSKLIDVNPLLPEDEMCPMKPISFKSRDGLTINGYLTLPKGVNPKKLPVVVIPHSNAEARNTWGFNAEVQFLANRGYAVFQINFRGSTGYGKKFWTAGFKNWGTGIQDDITDGVRWLIDNDIANPAKIAIYGTSFGGYSALQGISLHPELYACGISYAGITNLFTYIKAIPPFYKPYLQMIYEKVGNPENEADYFRTYSPIFHADKIKTPILIVQGTKDPRVNVNETNQFVRELKKRGVAVTYVLKQDEGHSFRNQGNRQEFYKTLEKFLEENLNKK